MNVQKMMTTTPHLKINSDVLAVFPTKQLKMPKFPCCCGLSIHRKFYLPYDFLRFDWMNPCKNTFLFEDGYALALEECIFSNKNYFWCPDCPTSLGQIAWIIFYLYRCKENQVVVQKDESTWLSVDRLTSRLERFIGWTTRKLELPVEDKELKERCFPKALIATQNGKEEPRYLFSALSTLVCDEAYEYAESYEMTIVPGMMYIIRSIIIPLLDLPIANLPLSIVLEYVFGSEVVYAMPFCDSFGNNLNDKDTLMAYYATGKKTGIVPLIERLRTSLNALRRNKKEQKRRRLCEMKQ